MNSETEGLLTRAQAAERLGVSVSEVRRREDSGKLRPKKLTQQGWHMFDPEDVDALAATRAGTQRKPLYTCEEAARVFEALDAGTPLVQCVRTCNVHPEVLPLIAEAYARLSGGIYLTKSTMDAINALPLEGTFPLRSEAEVLAVLVTAAEDLCKTCKKRPRAMCKACAAARDGF